MFTPRFVPLMRPVFVLAAAAFVFASSADAQSHSGPDNAVVAPTESSSIVPQTFDSSSEFAALPASPAPARAEGGAAGAGGQGNSGSQQGMLHRLTFEAGVGASGPTGDSSGYITWGGNITVGGGLHFSDHLAGLLEYQFIDDKLPGAIIAETGANGGNAHIWSLTLAPVIDISPKRTNDFYFTGGGGFYRKVTNFTDPQESYYCDYYYCGPDYANVVVGHFSSNQGGWNIGGGYIRRLGGFYGDSKTKLFAEARYLDVDSPAVTSSPNGLGVTRIAAGTKLVPITLGVRW